MSKFLAALAELATVLDQKLTPAGINGYRAVLSDFDDEDLARACVVFARSTKWMPKPSEFIDLITEGRLSGSDVHAEAAKAWAAVQAVCSNSTRVEALCAADPRVRTGIDALGGWFTMLNGGEDPKWQRKTFIDAFCGEAQEQRRLAIAAGSERLLGPGEAPAASLPAAVRKLAHHSAGAPARRSGGDLGSVSSILNEGKNR